MNKDTSQPGSSRKWIKRRLAALDPTQDFEEIIKLSTLYRANDFQLAWFFSVGTPAAGISEHVLKSVWRNGKGAAPDRRRDDSCDHLMTWFEHGPDHAATKTSIDMVNQYHKQFAKKYQESFENVEDYIYILCMNATFFHVAAVNLGLQGFDEKQKTACCLFWTRLSKHFTLGTTGESVTDIAGFPLTFDEMVAVVDRYQQRQWPVHQTGHDYTMATADFFASTWFPRPLQFFGRALVTACLADGVVRAHAIKVPSAPVRYIARSFMKMAIWFSEHMLPDPAETLPDKRRHAAMHTGCPVSPVDAAVHRRMAANGGPPLANLCPHMQAVQAARNSSSGSKPA